MKYVRMWVLCIGFVVLANVPAAFTQGLPMDVRVVDDNAGSGGDGTSWSTAYRYLQDALEEASDPSNNVNEIWVAQGIYRLDEDADNPDGTGNRDASFALINDVQMLGGFAGDEVDPLNRDPVQNETVLSGDLNNDDEVVIESDPFDIVFNNYDDNSHHIVTADDIGQTTILDGFTITGGNSSDAGPNNKGASGLDISTSSFNVLRCRITSNLGAGTAGAQ